MTRVRNILKPNKLDADDLYSNRYSLRSPFYFLLEVLSIFVRQKLLENKLSHNYLYFLAEQFF